MLGFMWTARCKPLHLHRSPNQPPGAPLPPHRFPPRFVAFFLAFFLIFQEASDPTFQFGHGVVLVIVRFLSRLVVRCPSSIVRILCGKMQIFT